MLGGDDTNKERDLAAVHAAVFTGADKLTAAPRALGELEDRCREAVAWNPPAQSGVPDAPSRYPKPTLEARRRLNAAAHQARRPLDEVRIARNRTHLLLSADDAARKAYDATETSLLRAHAARTQRKIDPYSPKSMSAALKDAGRARMSTTTRQNDLVGPRL